MSSSESQMLRQNFLAARKSSRWRGVLDSFSCLIGRTAGRCMRMNATATSRGIVAVGALQQQRFEAILRSFHGGYNCGFAASAPAALAEALDRTPLSLRGFAYEGAAMALAIRGALNPWRESLLSDFIADRGAAYTYLLHVGAGWSFGWVPGARTVFEQLDPLLRWLAFDGMGFRDCFFKALHSPKPVIPPKWIGRCPYAARAYDQGVGRCLWFAGSAKIEEVYARIAAFAAERQPDLWAGVGLAAIYAGVPTSGELLLLRTLARSHHAALAQGAVFAAKALERGGQLTEWHSTACRCLCGLAAVDAARVADAALPGLASDGPRPAYEEWRQRIQGVFSVAARPMSSL